MAHKILIVEDEPNIANVFRDQLKFSGFEVEVANGGAQALEILKSNHYDLIFLDLVMPEVDGLAVLKGIASDPKTYKEIPVLMLTNVTSKEIQSEVDKYHFVKDYIVKTDTEPTTLKEAVNKILKT